PAPLRPPGGAFGRAARPAREGHEQPPGGLKGRARAVPGREGDMATILVTGSGGLVGSEAVRFFAGQGYHVVRVDNDLRSAFFGRSASTLWNRTRLQQEFAGRYQHYHLDIRDRGSIENLFKEFAGDIDLIIHTAAQPSHDWAARDPHTDFTVNANGTL